MLRSLYAVAVSALALLLGTPSRAADIYSSDGFDIRWDNTFRYSANVRVDDRNPYLLASPNRDDGDRNFAPGLSSNRLDWQSILDVTRDGFGLQASFDAWYDTVYHARTATGAKFAPDVRNIEGQYIELADTFAYGSFSIGDVPVTVRAGRQTLLWGESLFFDDNSIAAAQAPVDYQKIVTMPVPYSNNVYLPVDQVSIVVQPRSNISLSAYYQFVWRGSRLPAVGSYFSMTDVLGIGAQRLYLGPGVFLIHDTDEKPNEGQLGIALHLTEDDLDLGFYALRYDTKYPILNVKPAAGEFNSIYPSSIWLYGTSFSTYVDNINVAGELAWRHRVPIMGYSPPDAFAGLLARGQTFSEYADGNTLHAQVSGATTLPPAGLWDSADLSAELSSNYIVNVTDNTALLELGRYKFSTAVRTHFEPHYFEVAPNLDLSLPIGLGYVIHGQYGSAYMVGQGAGDFEGGVSLRFMSVWTADLTFTRFFGSTTRQPLTDRSFIAFDIERTF